MMSSNPRNSRGGSATVELAVVSPFVFLFIFGIVEFGRLLMAIHGLETAAREGCRTAIIADATSQDVKQTIANRLAAFGISNYRLTVAPNSLSDAEQWDPITVRIETTYDNVSWLPTPDYLKGKKLKASSTLPREASND